jgi:NitT/TauT family transport system permease protein
VTLTESPSGPEGPAGPDEYLDADLAGLDRLEAVLAPPRSRARRLWMVTWPKLAAVAIGLFVWQVVVWTHWKPQYVLPGPVPTMKRLWDQLSGGTLLAEAGRTLSQGAVGYLIGLVVGTSVAIVVNSVPLIRTAVKPLISGLQTMPSAAWTPLAVGLFGLRNGPILFVTVIGSAPAIAIGTLAAMDAVPPALLRAGRVLGARGISSYRHVILPAALPGYVTGLKQGWAFAWRSLMAAELIVTAVGKPSLGNRLQQFQANLAYPDMLAVMVTILIIGLALDGLVFSRLERVVLERRGLTAAR